jgi:tRNA(Ile)-lysidine synthase
VSELLNRVEQSIRARRSFRPGQGILVAVSGGVDSMVLLHLLRELAPRHNWRLTIAHLNHRLRGRSSEADERLVRRVAKKLRLPVVVERAEVRRFARARKLSLEMAARALRHEFLARTARRRHLATVALAHHADDQLELFFLRLLRGSGGEGLAGMKWQSASPADAEIALVRPLLDLPKTALAEYAAQQGIRHREDATNALLDFQRNRIRHELLPLLRSKYQPALARTIARVMDIVGADAEFAGEAALDWLRKAKGRSADLQSALRGRRRAAGVRVGARSKPTGSGRSGGFEELPVAVQRRCVQLQLRRLGVEPDYELVEQLRMAVGRAVPISRPQGAAGKLVLYCAIRDSTGLVRLQAPRQETFKADAMLLKLQGRAGEVEFCGSKVQWRISSKGPAGRPTGEAGREFFDADRVGGTVHLRHWRPGDRFHPIGMPGSVKLQDLFTNQKVPRDQRRRLILAATARGEVFWVQNMRISERFKLTKQTNRYLQWRWKGV